MQRKLQLHSKFRAFIVKLSSFHKRTITVHKWDEISNYHTQNSFWNQKRDWKSRKIPNLHWNRHKKLNSEKSRRRRRRRIKSQVRFSDNRALLEFWRDLISQINLDEHQKESIKNQTKVIYILNSVIIFRLNTLND